jgi:hypothetical protein
VIAAEQDIQQSAAALCEFIVWLTESHLEAICHKISYLLLQRLDVSPIFQPVRQ